MTDDTQPEAMDLADWLEAVGGGPSAKRCAALLREQHTRIAELESQLAQRFDAADMATAAAQGFRDGVASVTSELPSWDEVFDCAVAAYCRSSASHDALRLCFQSRSQQHQITCGWTANDLMGFARGVAALYAPPTSAEGVEHG